MKLVTGIEAIQSGKPFRYCYQEDLCADSYSEWMTALSRWHGDLKQLLERKWEIKPEPREFWIQLSEYNNIMNTFDCKPCNCTSGTTIKVREMLDE